MHIVHPPILPDNPRIERFSSRRNEITRLFYEILFNDFTQRFFRYINSIYRNNYSYLNNGWN